MLFRSHDARLSPAGGWYSNRAMSWEAREDYFRQDPRSATSWSSRSPNGRDGPANSGSVSHWMDAPYMPSPRTGSHYDVPAQSWEASAREWGQHHHPPHHPYLTWSSGSNSDMQQQRDENEKNFNRDGREHMGFDGEQRHPMHFTLRSAPPQPHGMDIMMGSPMPTSSGIGETSSMIKAHSLEMMDGNGRGLDKNRPIKILALPEDRISLSETLCIVREVS